MQTIRPYPSGNQERFLRRAGTYALVYHARRALRVRVGRLGPIDLAFGCWIYVGSAFGPGGLGARLRHHLRPNRRPHWHLDYIKMDLQPMAVWTSCDHKKREHLWASVLAGLEGASRPVAGFGASDCSCRSHLIHRPRPPKLERFEATLLRRAPRHAPIRAWVPQNVLADTGLPAPAGR